MIKKILVALDPDTDTPIATRYAADIARRYEAEVTGLAVVDMGSIEADARGGGIGSMYLSEKIQENLTTEARNVARDLTNTFQEEMADTGVRHNVQVEEGAPFERIVEDMKYHDLLVVGNEPHFFYSHPERETRTLVRVVKDTIAPSLVVVNQHRPVQRVLIAYDESPAAARSLRRFIHLKPFGTDVTVEILFVDEKGTSKGAELALHMARSYMSAHGFNARTFSIAGRDAAAQIIEYANTFEADLVVAGAHSVSTFRKLAFGSTTASLLKDCHLPLWLDH